MVYPVETQEIKGSTNVSPVLCESPINFIKPRMSSATTRIAPPSSRVRQSPVCVVTNSILNQDKKKSSEQQHGSRAASKTPTKSVQRASANSRKSQRHHVIAAIESSSSSSSSFSEDIVGVGGSTEMPYTIYQTIHEAINEVVPMAIHKALESLTQQLQQQHLSNKLSKQKKGSAAAPPHMQKCSNEAPAIVAPVVEAIRAPTPPPPQIGHPPQHHYYARPTQQQPPPQPVNNYHLQQRDNRPQTPFHYKSNDRGLNMNAVQQPGIINTMPYYQYAPVNQPPPPAAPVPQQTPLYDNYMPPQPFVDYMGQLYSSPFNNLACQPQAQPPQQPQQPPNNGNNNPSNFAPQYDGMLMNQMNQMYQPGPFYPTIFV